MDKVGWARITGQMDQIKRKVNDPKEEKALMDACEGFEAVYMEKVMAAMRKTLPGNGLFEDSNSMDIYQSMHDRHLADQLAQSQSGLGLKQFLFDELKKSL